MNQSTMLISWSFPEFVLPERSRTWYLVAAVIGLLLLFYAILAANFLFGLILILAVVVMFMQHHKEAVEVQFGITPDGIVVGDSSFAFSDIKNFYLVYEPPQIKNIYFEFNSFWRPRLTIPLEDINPLKVRSLLLAHLKEDLTKENQPLSEALSKRFKL